MTDTVSVFLPAGTTARACALALSEAFEVTVSDSDSLVVRRAEEHVYLDAVDVSMTAEPGEFDWVSHYCFPWDPWLVSKHSVGVACEVSAALAGSLGGAVDDGMGWRGGGVQWSERVREGHTQQPPQLPLDLMGPAPAESGRLQIPDVVLAGELRRQLEDLSLLGAAMALVASGTEVNEATLGPEMGRSAGRLEAAVLDLGSAIGLERSCLSFEPTLGGSDPMPVLGVLEGWTHVEPLGPGRPEHLQLGVDLTSVGLLHTLIRGLLRLDPMSTPASLVARLIEVTQASFGVRLDLDTLRRMWWITFGYRSAGDVNSYSQAQRQRIASAAHSLFSIDPTGPAFR